LYRLLFSMGTPFPLAFLTSPLTEGPIECIEPRLLLVIEGLVKLLHRGPNDSHGLLHGGMNHNAGLWKEASESMYLWAAAGVSIAVIFAVIAL
jgi:hypothetical protein